MLYSCNCASCASERARKQPPPKYAGAIRLFRKWGVGFNQQQAEAGASPLDGYYLRSMSAGYTWQPWAQEAHQHPCSGDGTHIGFHGFFNLVDAMSYGAFSFGGEIMGTFLSWGKMVRHDLGMRTEWAQPEYLIKTPLAFNNLMATNRPVGHPLHDYEATCDAICVKYGMSPIGLDVARALTNKVPFTVDMIKKSDEEIAKEIEDLFDDPFD